MWNTSDTSWEATYRKSPHRHLLPREDYLPPPDPLVQADTLSVDAEARESSTDGLIDDVINLTIDDSIWVERAKNMALLVIYHILSTSYLWTVNLGRTPINLQTSRGRAPCITQDLSGMGHPHPLTTGIPTQRKVGGLGNWHQIFLVLNKNKNRKTESLVDKLNHAAHVTPPSMVLPHNITPSYKRG